VDGAILVLNYEIKVYVKNPIIRCLIANDRL
jgi:hypothetical protein